MYRFDYRLVNNQIIIFTEHEGHRQEFILYFNKELTLTEHFKIWVAINITHWVNTQRGVTFKQICRKFEAFCNSASKLKI